MMDSPSITKTRSNLAEIYRESERNICKALIEHYKEIQTETERQINHTEKAIDSHLHKDAQHLSNIQHLPSETGKEPGQH